MSGVNFAGNVPQIYDRNLGPVWFTKYAKDMADRVASGRPSKVLEVACGTGIVTHAMRKALPHTTITATDISPDMLKVAHEKLTDGVTFQPVDGTKLPFPERSFDAVVCQFGIMFFPDKPAGIREAYRVLSSGGRYLFSVWDTHDFNPLGQVLNSTLASLFPHNPPRFYEIPFGYAQVDVIRAALQHAGFGRLEISVIPYRHDMIDFQAFGHGSIFGSPVMGQIVERGGIAPEQVEEAVVEALRKELDTEPTVVPLQAILFSAEKD